MSLGDTYVTVQGWVGSDLDFKEISGRTARVTFRVGSTPRQFDRALGTWIDKSTTWFNVECWRHLAQNAFESVQVGQPVIVTGRLRTHEWTDDAGERHSRVILEAFSIGHDLNRGTATFSRNPPRPAVDSTEREATSATETTAAPYPAEEYTATPVPLTPTSHEQEAA